jgi:AraC-like DNA-binding protein
MTCIFEGARVRNGRIPSDSARWLARQVRSMGVPLAAILEGTRLAEDWLDDENALITPEQYLAVVGNSLDATGDPALGLTVGPRQYLGDLGFLGYAIISSPTLLEANQTALKFWELNGSLVTLSCREEGEFLSWEILPAFPIPVGRLWIYAVEELLTTFYKAAGFLSNQAFRFSEIRLSYPEPGHGHLYRELFECPVIFGAGADLFKASISFGGLQTYTGHPQMAEVCRQQCQAMQERLRGSDELVASIREIIVSCMGRLPRLPEVAGTLAMSPRTLRRRLKERSTTYQHILDEVRAELAKEYVSSTILSVEQIAGRIGFTEATTFRRAFRKWTGMSIREYRRKEAKKAR